MTPIEHLRELMAESTGDEWRSSTSGHFILSGSDCIASFVNCDGDTYANKALVVAMRNNLPALLEIAEAAIEVQHQAAKAGPFDGEQSLEDAFAGLDKAIALLTTPPKDQP